MRNQIIAKQRKLEAIEKDNFHFQSEYERLIKLNQELHIDIEEVLVMVVLFKIEICLREKNGC